MWVERACAHLLSAISQATAQNREICEQGCKSRLSVMGPVLTPMQGCIGRHSGMGRSRPDTRSSVLQLFLDLGSAERNKFRHDLSRLCLCHAGNQVTESPNSIGLRVGCTVVVYELENQIEERVRELLADGIQHHFDSLQDGLFRLATGGVPLPSFFRQVLIQGEHPSEKRQNPVCVPVQ